jgi:hypothetical protein
MRAADADAFLNECIDKFDAFPLNCRMIAAAICVKENGIGSFKRGVTARPADCMQLGFDSRRAVQTLLEQQAAGAEFMIARTVAWFAGDEQDFLVGSRDA